MVIVRPRRNPIQTSTYTIDGKKYSTFDEKVATAMQTIGDGERVELTLQHDGDYENIVAASKLS
jgi:hypothetical protein